MKDLLADHLEDCSTSQYFCFTIRCERCDEFWYSSAVPFSKAGQADQYQEKKELYQAIYQREKKRAAKLAVQEAKECFNQCPICHRLVCDACFMICDEIDMCQDCAIRLGENGEPVIP